MREIPLEFSVVVVGQDCNPTILNPDFLTYRGIVPADLEWSLSGSPITTPAISVVQFSSGVTIKVEQNRVQVTDAKPNEGVSGSKIVEIAQEYIRVLPHVRYTGVGINFRRLIEMSDPESFLKNRFLARGPWIDGDSPAMGVNLKLVYPHEDGQLNISLEGNVLVHQIGDQSEQLRGILVHANYHRDCSGYPTDEKVIEYIGRAQDDEYHFRSFLKKLLFEED